MLKAYPMWTFIFQDKTRTVVPNVISDIELTLAGPPVDTTRVITCMNFENGFRASKGIYVQSYNVVIRNDGRFQHAAFFNGVSASLEVPFFTGTYR